jgi:Gas vesicle synthesis protein GvpL/GvpF
VTDELYWAYCVSRADEPGPASLTGVDGTSEVERVEESGLAALVSRVPRSDFGAEPLRENLNDLAWLERVARAHEAVLDQALAAATIVPLRMCTIYESPDSVRQMLAREREALGTALELLAGREEWSVKVLVDPERVARAVEASSGDAGALEQELEGRGGGAAYMLRRRQEREVRERAGALVADMAQSVHAQVEELSLAAVTRPPQNRSLSRHEGRMVLNAAYLLDASRVDELRERVAELNATHSDLGARVELVGPWPPYNFVPGGAAVV